MSSESMGALKFKLIAAIQTYRNRMMMGKREKDRNKIFCIGLNKTGTTSWAKAMRDLGYVVGSETKATMFYYDWVNGDYSRTIKYCRTDGEAFQDIPFSLPETFLELDAVFSNGKFVLTIRDTPEQWYNSLIKFHGKFCSPSGDIPPSPKDLLRAKYWKKGLLADYCHDVFKTPISNPYHRETLLEFYVNYNAEVEDYFRDRPEKLLVLNVTKADAFNKLREFLNLPRGVDEFPWENKN